MRKRMRQFTAGILTAMMTASFMGGTMLSAAQEEEATGAGAMTADEAPSVYYQTDPEELVGEEGMFEGLTIGFSQRSVAGSSWYENLIRIAQEEAEYLGAEIVVTDADGDLAKQIADIEDLIAQDVDAIIVNPVDSFGIIVATDKVHEAGIPLINVNSQMDDGANPTCFVGHDTYSFGYAAGTALAEQYDAKFGCPDEIQAAILLGFPKELYSIYESNGMLSGFTSYYLEKYNKLNLNIVAGRYGEYSADVALQQTDDVLAAFPDVDIIFSLDGIMLMGAVSSLKSAGMEGDVLLCAAGGRKEELEMIMSQEEGLVASATCDPRQEGKWAVLMAAYAASGVDIPQTFYIESQGITPDNVEELYDPDSQY
ncbi:MAG TPA: substrate-binding domain-containing protein [Candidatus Choladousia intestinigallinarum]|nr:substrate-binding domain-containing protein [Candidatus Choladousia intestinigallinarum]